MAISNLTSASPNFDRPSVSAYFGGRTNPVNDNLQKTSSMFDDPSINRMIGALGNLNSELSKTQEMSQGLIRTFKKFIRDLQTTRKEVISKFTRLNTDINSSKVEFAKSAFTTPKLETSPIEEIGAPIIATKNDIPVTPAGDGGAFDIKDTLLGMLGGMGLTTALISTLKTVAAFFVSNPLGIGLLSGSLVAYGIYDIMGGMIRDYNKKLGITDDMSQKEIEDRKKTFQAERKEAPYRELAQRTMLMKEIMDGKHDAAIGVTPSMEIVAADRIRSKIAEDVSNGNIDPRIKKIPALPTREERITPEPGYGGAAGSMVPQTNENAPKTQQPQAPAPKQTAVQKSRANRERARQESKGTPTTAPAIPNKAGGEGPQGDGVKQYPGRVNTEHDPSSYYKKGEINRYETDPRPDLLVGSTADIVYNGTEHERKIRYLDFMTNPEAEGKSASEAGYQGRGLSDMYNEKGFLSPIRARSSIGFSEYEERSKRAPQGDGAYADQSQARDRAKLREGLLRNPVTGELLKGTGTPTLRQRARGQVMESAARESKAGFERIQFGASGENYGARNQTTWGEKTIGGMKTSVPIYYNPVTDKSFSPEAVIKSSERTRPEMLRGRMEQFDRQQTTAAMRVGEESRIRSSVKPLQPVVMNNSSSTNIGSTGGSETNNVSGQNFPMEASNPALLPFITRQNVQYQ